VVAVASTGKVATFTYAAKAGTAQITKATVDETSSADVIQTLGGSVAIAQGVESEVSCDFLYDGIAAAGFYAALHAALVAGTAGALVVTASGASKWNGSAIVTALSAEIPADGAMTCSATLSISGTLTWVDV
jgi:predicted secreted protein